MKRRQEQSIEMQQMRYFEEKQQKVMLSSKIDSLDKIKNICNSQARLCLSIFYTKMKYFCLFI